MSNKFLNPSGETDLSDVIARVNGNTEAIQSHVEDLANPHTTSTDNIQGNNSPPLNSDDVVEGATNRYLVQPFNTTFDMGGNQILNVGAVGNPSGQLAIGGATSAIVLEPMGIPTVGVLALSGVNQDINLISGADCDIKNLNTGDNIRLFGDAIQLKNQAGANYLTLDATDIKSFKGIDMNNNEIKNVTSLLGSGVLTTLNIGTGIVNEDIDIKGNGVDIRSGSAPIELQTGGADIRLGLASGQAGTLQCNMSGGLDMNTNDILNANVLVRASNGNLIDFDAGAGDLELQSGVGNNIEIKAGNDTAQISGANAVLIGTSIAGVQGAFSSIGETTTNMSQTFTSNLTSIQQLGNQIIRFEPTIITSSKNIDMNNNDIENVNSINGLTAVGGVYAGTSDGTLIDNTTEQSLLPLSGVGSLTIPANGFSVGDCFHCVVAGDCSFDKADTIQIKLKENGSILAQTPVFALEDAKGANNAFEIEIDFTIRSIGATGSIGTNFDFTYNKTGLDSKDFRGTRAMDVQPIDTTVSSTLDVTVQFPTNVTPSTLQTRLFRLQKVY
jgi:hypothetical protein